MARKKPVKKGKKLGSTKLQRSALKRVALERVATPRAMPADDGGEIG